MSPEEALEYLRDEAIAFANEVGWGEGVGKSITEANKCHDIVLAALKKES